ncbi:MAG: hypothetical protein ACYCTE_03870 [Acidimicrobiales bacterium]
MSAPAACGPDVVSIGLLVSDARVLARVVADLLRSASLDTSSRSALVSLGLQLARGLREVPS